VPKQIIHVGQSEAHFLHLPFTVQVQANKKLDEIATAPTEHVIGTFSEVENDTKLRYFRVGIFAFIYAIDKKHNRIYLFKIRVLRDP
jgi:mRNA-degrading endonuclease RelE of RelBE toxin-antitoxin system